MNIIIVAGMPASGKTTFVNKLSKALGYPVLEKDAIKEELFDVIGFQNYAQKRLMDVAATAVLLRCADSLLSGGQSMILVYNFRADAAPTVEAMLEKHNCGCIFLFFGGDGDVFYERYVQRDLVPTRHLGHVLQDRYPPQPGDPLTYSMTREEFASKFEHLGMNQFQISRGTRIDIDATYPERIDTEAVIAQIRSLL